MTEETPAKIFSLLGVAMTSMFFLFAVTVTNASFTQTEKPFPVAFNPEQVVAVLDNSANSYSKFIDENLVRPQKQSFAILQYNVNYVIDEAGPSILAYTGLTALADIDSIPAQAASPKVAGAFTKVAARQSLHPRIRGFSIDSIYSLLIR